MNVLFVCVQNAGRSQMAERSSAARRGTTRGALRRLEPGPRRAPEVRRGAARASIDVSDRVAHAARRARRGVGRRGRHDGCGDACPFVPGKRYKTGSSPTRTASPLERVRAIRDEIAAESPRCASSTTAPERNAA